MSVFNYNNKTFLVTGAAGGIGKILTRRLLSKGAKVLACDLNLENLKIIQKELDSFSANLEIAKLDVTNEESWNKSIQVVQQKEWELYGIVNCAAILKPGYLDEAELSEIHRHIDINVKGTMIGSMLGARIFSKAKKGHIINIASLAGVAPIPGIALYSTSKFAVRGFTLALAMEMKPKNVSVTVICPDAVNTPMLDLQTNYKEAALTFSGTTLTPEEVVNEILSSLEKNKLEVLLPAYRGVLAKLGNIFPFIASILLEPLRNKGLNKQKELLKK
ncbi:MAG: SDR family oxidoreductase [Leptospiraceae bacterium]|nr:SDR family oxidoreductase [Leptospiraceae bacterium]